MSKPSEAPIISAKSASPPPVGSSDTANKTTERASPSGPAYSFHKEPDTENQPPEEVPSPGPAYSFHKEPDTENQPPEGALSSDGTGLFLKTPDTKNQIFGKQSAVFQLNNEIRLSNNFISVNQKGFFADIPYTKLSFEYSRAFFDFFMEVRLSSQDQQATRLSEIHLTRSFKKIPVKFKIGRQTLPLGYRPENAERFLRELSLYRSIEKQEEDTGLTAQVNLWKQYLYLQVSCFAGYIKRGGEDFYRAPDTPPLIVSLKTKGALGEGFITWLKKIRLFSSPCKPRGAGGGFPTPCH